MVIFYQLNAIFKYFQIRKYKKIVDAYDQCIVYVHSQANDPLTIDRPVLVPRIDFGLFVA